MVRVASNNGVGANNAAAIRTLSSTRRKEREVYVHPKTENCHQGRAKLQRVVAVPSTLQVFNSDFWYCANFLLMKLPLLPSDIRICSLLNIADSGTSSQVHLNQPPLLFWGNSMKEERGGGGDTFFRSWGEQRRIYVNPKARQGGRREEGGE